MSRRVIYRTQRWMMPTATATPIPIIIIMIVSLLTPLTAFAALVLEQFGCLWLQLYQLRLLLLLIIIMVRLHMDNVTIIIIDSGV